MCDCSKVWLQQYLYENGCGCPWHKRTCCEAARNGHLDVVQFAHEHECPRRYRNMSYCSRKWAFTCVEYAHVNGYPWNASTCWKAAGNGHHLRVLQYAHENGCQWNERTCSNAAGNGHLHVWASLVRFDDMH
jgi:hypothetical protein